MPQSNLVLIIEDEKGVRESIADILSLKGFSVLEAENGEVGYTIAKRHTPNVVLCDIMMPVLNGFDTIKKFKTEPKLSQVKFVFLTAKIEETNKLKALELGADAFMHKPFKVAELIDIIS